jgi:protein tyrosine phosphatase (PTP) superfamily phosphohydrolase (DUF442 family)
MRIVGNRRKTGAISAAILSMALLASAPACGARGVPAADGIEDFGQVNKAFFRGGCPSPSGMKKLSERGVKVIIDLTKEKRHKAKHEERLARHYGMVYTNVLLRGLGRPTDEQVRHVLELIDSAQGPVFLHCWCACDRTGCIVACYRIRHDGWTTEAAIKEAWRYGLSAWEKGMKRYILAYRPNAIERAQEPEAQDKQVVVAN